MIFILKVDVYDFHSLGSIDHVDVCFLLLFNWTFLSLHFQLRVLFVDIRLGSKMREFLYVLSLFLSVPWVIKIFLKKTETELKLILLLDRTWPQPSDHKHYRNYFFNKSIFHFFEIFFNVCTVVYNFFLKKNRLKHLLVEGA